MKIVVINGSPKKDKSSTIVITKAFISGIVDICKDCNVEYINVSDLKITPCMGCLSCWGRTEGECVIKNDDMTWVKEKIEDADLVIESYPLYFFGMPGTMKVFTDRLVGMMNSYKGQSVPENGESFHGIRNPKPNRRFLVISSCAYMRTKEVYLPLKMQYDCICGKDKYQLIAVPEVKNLIVMNVERRTNKFLSKFVEAGREYALNPRLKEETLEKLSLPPFPDELYTKLMVEFWQQEKNSNQGGK